MKMKFKKVFMLFLCGTFGISVLIHPMTAEAKESEWIFEYAGSEQEFVAPYSGIYQLEATGAQGGNADLPGGKGGRVLGKITLKKGERIVIDVGGQDGYNGGGTGNISNGGGATEIYINEARIAVAGGGGGGNAGFAGGDGGIEKTGASGTGEGMSTLVGAGGGAGYYGGGAGMQYIVEHVHDGDEKSGGTCYTPVYHKHSGSSSSGGGCYNVSVYHEHKDDCYNTGHWCVWGTPYLAGGTPSAWVVKCECGETSVASTAEGCKRGNHKYYKGTLKCTKSEAEIEAYVLGCGKNNNTIVGYEFSCDKVYDDYKVVQSQGGSNWYDEEVCLEGTSEAGVQEGNGRCCVKMLSVNNLFYEDAVCCNVYYDGSKVEKVYYNDILIYKK